VQDIKDEAEVVTSLLQNEVVGGQLINYSLTQLKKYSPTIEPSLVPSIFILYIERGELKHLQAKCNRHISLGTKRKPITAGIRSFLQRMISYLI
jgi:hypothetical protein